MRTAAATLLLVAASVAAVSGQRAPDSHAISREIGVRIEQLRNTGRLRIADVTLARSDALLGVYERRAFAPLWSDNATLRDLMRVIAEVSADGLYPDHYSLPALASHSSLALSPAMAAELDLLATDALIRVAHDLRFGRVEPSGPTTGRTLPSPFGGTDPVADLTRIVADGRVREAMRAAQSSHPVYQGLVRALAELRRVQAAGGWEEVPAGPSMRRDSVDVRVPRLRVRLAHSGDLAPDLVTADPLFDRELEHAVRAFQHRHGLNEDGVVGPSTLAALNVPIERRIDEVRVNLERARWVTHDLPNTFVAVNVAGARAYLVRDGSVVFETRAIVGKSYTRTPVFSAPMRHIDLNPTWTVPPGIVGEVLARVKREPGYLGREGMRVLDGGGRRVDPSTIDFSSYTARTFPYVFRQDPGPANALGQIKFVFPNPHNVYLHDTPSRSLFAREERLFSHGCIRIENPLALAELVLNDPVRWSRPMIEAAIALGATRTIQLAQPLPVLILYWTASTDLHGELHFYRDVYGRDAELLAALNRP